jgi:predicted ATPase
MCSAGESEGPRKRSLGLRLFRELLARLVTPTGPGGVGRTRLVGRIAARLERAFPDAWVTAQR